MTQTFPKPDFQKTNNSRSSSAKTAQGVNRTPATDYPSSRPLSEQGQTALESGAGKLLELEQSAKTQWGALQEQLASWGKWRLAPWWKALSLRSKATALAATLSVIPLTTVGGIAYTLASQSVTRQIIADQEDRTVNLAYEISVFTKQLVDDLEAIASSPLLAEPQLSAATSLKQKSALLNSFIDARNGQYDSIAVFDLRGNLLFQSKSPQPLSGKENYSERKSFQRAIATQAPAVERPKLEQSSSKVSLEVAAPIREKGTDRMLGVILSRVPITHFNPIFETMKAQSWEYKLVGSNGQIFGADEEKFIGQPVGSDFDELPQLLSKVLKQKAKMAQQDGQENKELVSSQLMRDRNEGKDVLVSFTSIEGLEDLVESSWGLAVSRNEALNSLAELRWALLLGTGAAALLVGAIAAALAELATHPILSAAIAVEKIGRGELNTRLEVRGEDEFAALGANINDMAAKLDALVLEKGEEARLSGPLKNITLQLSQLLSAQELFEVAVGELCQAIQADRTLIYTFGRLTGKGTVIAESVAGNWARTLGAEIADPGFAKQHLDDYQQAQVLAISDIDQADLSEFHRQHLKSLAVKAKLVAPILMGGQLRGLLIAHQCSRSRKWEKPVIDLFSQVAAQLGLALERADLLEKQQLAEEEQRGAKEKLQKRALELLLEVDPVSQGDLTVQAKVTNDEIGTIADSYNSALESLRKIVTQVQAAAEQVATTASNNEASVQGLSEEGLKQAGAIAAALERIQAMASSARTVAASAAQAEAAVQNATETVEAGDAAMNRTVDGILGIRETVAETAKKVKRLGESSQKIYQVVNLINSFAEQTNLLALNASIEAAHAGEHGRGFAVVAEEVRSLALQSAGATAEIEALVAEIQSGTNEVVTAMEEGTEQVVTGTKLVDETRQSLNQIAAASDQINQLVGAIAQAAVEQSQASEAVTQTMAEVAAISDKTSAEAIQVSESFKQLLAVAQSLQENASQFKVK